MYNEVKIGSRTVPMLSMASVDVYYREIFHEDPIKLQVTENQDPGAMYDFTMKMGFVMAKFAETKDRKEMLKLSLFDYLDWLDQFDRMDIANALEDVQKTYNGQSITTANAKKNNAELIDS